MCNCWCSQENIVSVFCNLNIKLRSVYWIWPSDFFTPMLIIPIGTSYPFIVEQMGKYHTVKMTYVSILNMVINM